MAIYFSWRVLGQWRLPIWARMLLSGLIVGFFEHHWLVSEIFGTSVASPELPRPILIGLGGVYGVFLISVMLVALRDIAGLVILVVSKSVGQRVLNSCGATLAICGVGIGASVYSVYEAVRVPDIKTLEVTLTGLPSGLDGYKLVLLTDLHISKLFQRDWVEKVVSKTNSLSANAIVISGDLVDGLPEDRKLDIAPLSSLEAQDGIYAVTGNHEYYAAYDGWLRAFDELGIHLLENSHVVIKPELGGFVLAGVPDEVSAKFGQERPDVMNALAGRPPELPAVLLDHRPGRILANAKAGVDLQLSGHTHGGHIRGVDLVVKAFNNGFVSGCYQVGASILYVSNGAGLWPGLSLRLGRPSEITEITLRSPEAATVSEQRLR